MYEKLRRDFTIQGKAQSTFTNYIRCLAHLALHYGVSPEKLDDEKVQDYLFLCKAQHKTPSDSFFKHTVYGLRAAYKVLSLPNKRIALPQIKRQKDLPIILNTSEIKALLNTPKYLRHRLMLGFLYGCGLRSYELCKLKLSDLDLERKTVLIRQQKGAYDRYLPLSKHLVRGLKTYFSEFKPQIYVFPSQVSSDGGEHPITNRAIQWLLKECRSKMDCDKTFTAHSLRHSFATHLLEDGVNILAVKELLGHPRIETTLIYLQVAQVGSSRKYSPLDILYGG